MNPIIAAESAGAIAVLVGLVLILHGHVGLGLGVGALGAIVLGGAGGLAAG